MTYHIPIKITDDTPEKEGRCMLCNARTELALRGSGSMYKRFCKIGHRDLWYARKRKGITSPYKAKRR